MQDAPLPPPPLQAYKHTQAVQIMTHHHVTFLFLPMFASSSTSTGAARIMSVNWSQPDEPPDTARYGQPPEPGCFCRRLLLLLPALMKFTVPGSESTAAAFLLLPDDDLLRCRSKQRSFTCERSCSLSTCTRSVMCQQTAQY